MHLTYALHPLEGKRTGGWDVSNADSSNAVKHKVIQDSAKNPRYAQEIFAGQASLLNLGEFSMNAIKDFLRGEEGAVAIEYALLGALIALAIAAGASVLGRDICGTFKGIATAVSTNIFTLPPNFAPCT